MLTDVAVRKINERMLEIGQIVFSKCGRDRGRPFVIISIEGTYLYLADGDLRKVQSPKKKKQKHVQITHAIVPEEIRLKLQKHMLLDADLQKILKSYYM